MSAAGLARPAHGDDSLAHRHAPGEGRIGPNAVTRVAEALFMEQGKSVRDRVFARAGLSRNLLHPPQAMIPDEDVAALHEALFAVIGADKALAIGAEAGRLTGRYLLENRIPRPAQTVLRLMPRALAARLLLAAIGRHAWTFAGSGSFAWSPSHGGLSLAIAGGPVSRRLAHHEPVCAYYASTFETIFRAILCRQTRVTEIACEACGHESCRFEVCFTDRR